MPFPPPPSVDVHRAILPLPSTSDKGKIKSPHHRRKGKEKKKKRKKGKKPPMLPFHLEPGLCEPNPPPASPCLRHGESAETPAGRSERSYLNDAAPPGDAGLAFPLLAGGKPLLLAAALRARRRRRARLPAGSRQGAVPVGDPAAGTVKAGPPAAAAFPISRLEGHLPQERPRGGRQPPAAGAAAAELRHQPPRLPQEPHRCPPALLPQLLGGGSSSAFRVFTTGGF